MTELAAHIGEHGQLLGLLDALGHRVEAEGPCQIDHRRRERHRTVAPSQGGDEGPIDLDDVNGEAMQVAERRVAGSEVVNRDLDAKALQLLEHESAELDVVHEHAFGQLECQMTCLEL